MDLSQALGQLEAAAEHSRLRLLAGLLPGESTVGDLVKVLEQSQPRVSRHLRLLAEAGLVESFREGRSIYYRLSEQTLAEGIGSFLASLSSSADPVVRRDRERLAHLRQQREREALRKVARLRRGAGEGPTSDLEEALEPVLGSGALGEVLDVGAGNGTLLRLLATRAERAVGVESAGELRELARARLKALGLPRWSIRDADPAELPFADASFDLVMLDEILARRPAAGTRHDPDRPQRIVREARRCLKSGGRLLVFDRIVPGSPAAGGGQLAEARVQHLLDVAGLRITRRQWLPGRVPDRALFLAQPEPGQAAFHGVSDHG